MNCSPSSCESQIRAGTGDLLRRSRLFHEYLAERERILRHKCYESQKAGYDIGFEGALMSWVLRHRAPWRRARSAPATS